MKILICTDGSASSIQSADLVVRFGFPAQTSITVLGVSENEQDLEKITSAMNLIESKLGKSYPLEVKVRQGEPIKEIISEALEMQSDLVAVGSGGKQLSLLHPQLGSTTSKLARNLFTHFLVTRNLPAELTKVLVCAGIEAPTSMTISIAGQILSNVPAQLGLLHVLPKIAASRVVSRTTTDQKDDSREYAANDPEKLLARTSQQLRQSGIKGEIIPIVRYGLVVEEVLSELSAGGYDLLVVGSHYQPGQDRWLGTLLDDVTDQLLNRSACSVLII